MELNEALASYIREGRYTGLKQAASDLGVSTTKVWYTLRRLEAEGVIESQSQYRVK